MAERVRRARLTNIPLSDDTPPDDMKKALNQTGANESKIVLFIENPDRDSQYDFLAKIPAEAFDLSLIQARYGPGQYRAIFYDNNDEEIRKQEFGVAAQPGRDDDDNGNDDKIDRLVAALMERENNRNADQSRQSTGLSATEILLPIVLKLLDGGNRPDPIAQFAAMAAVLKGDGGNAISPLAMMKELREEREAGIKLGERIVNGGESEGGFWPTAMKELAPAILTIASNAKTPAVGTPQVPAQIAATSSPDIPANLSWLLPLRGYLPVLLSKARQGKSPEVYADFLVEELKPEDYAKLEVSAKDPAFIETMIRAVPDFQAPELQQWGRNFLTQIRSHFVGEESDKPDLSEAIARNRESLSDDSTLGTDG